MPKTSKSYPLFDARHWFKDRCPMGVNGKALRGPGIICSIYLLLNILNILISLAVVAYIFKKNSNISKLNLGIFTLVVLSWSVLSLYFMYTACYICNGIRGLIFLFILGIFFNMILFIIFKSTFKELLSVVNNMSNTVKK